ncbi:hypothetical protein KDA_07620 [Dictyobacter alpinus]|uniref:ABC transmembrane type-2 domain-containing protein n=1 Tax=Dictyobacter alpinus TaxID=2014873 RepID=A0A402B1S5_9CHLR|nr:ABC transporter permease [Dictyobacter alpinus]GCE25278.1 hypothetical protein KDA_07620 [Dictyobacter alpinus]
MKNLFVMTFYQFKIVLRNRTLLVASLGIAIISMLIFGFLFKNTGTEPLKVGIVDQDQSATSAQIVTALKKDASLQISEGTRQALLDGVKNGELSALIILQKGFGSKLKTGGARALLYIDKSDLIGSARSKGSINGVFDAISKQTVGYKDLIKVDEQQISTQQLRTIDYLTPGMIGMTTMYANIYVGIALTTWRMNGVLKRLNATPLKAWQLIMAQILSQFLLSFLQAAIILAIAVTVFQVHITIAMLPGIAIAVLSGSFSIISLGYAVGNFVSRPNATQAVATLIALPMMFLGGSYFPVSPSGWLSIIVEIAPLTHLNRALHQIILNSAALPAIIPELGILLFTGLLLLFLSISTFRWSW